MSLQIGQPVRFLHDYLEGVVVDILTGDDRDSDWVHDFGDIEAYVVRWDRASKEEPTPPHFTPGETSVQAEYHLEVIV